MGNTRRLFCSCKDYLEKTGYSTKTGSHFLPFHGTIYFINKDYRNNPVYIPHSYNF